MPTKWVTILVLDFVVHNGSFRANNSRERFYISRPGLIRLMVEVETGELMRGERCVVVGG